MTITLAPRVGGGAYMRSSIAPLHFTLSDDKDQTRYLSHMCYRDTLCSPIVLDM